MLKLVGLYVIWTLFVSCGFTSDGGNKKVLIETTEGNIVVELFDATPQHRDNFLKLVEDKYYDSTLFHRVIKDFMIQAGDPESKGAAPGVMLGNGGPGYTIEAEILDTLFHKKGALSAARQGDNVNPEKRSSGSQFYIVTGRVFSKEEMAMMEQQMNVSIETKLMQTFLKQKENESYRKRLLDAQMMAREPEKQEEAQKIINELAEEIKPKAVKESDYKKFSEAQLEAYTSVGGAPHLDGEYTVFGQVVKGLEIAEKIGIVQGDRANRPLNDIKIISMKLVE